MTTNFITRFFQCLARTKMIQRFEFLLPTKQNDGTVIEPEKFDQTALELTDRATVDSSLGAHDGRAGYLTWQ